MRLPTLAAGALLLPGCSLGPSELPADPPPLRDLHEPLPLFEEPADEPRRRDLPPGSFTGVYVGDARESLEALLGEPEGLAVVRVVENSPGQAAGLEPGDLLLEVNAGSGPRALAWPSEWRALELESAPGSPWLVLYDRAGLERETELVPVPRLRPAERSPAERFREEDRAGVVVRTATEVEARAAGLGPGAGAVVVGLAKGSPWRAAGLRYGDLVVAVDGAPVSHPQVLLDAVRGAEPGAVLALDVRRGGTSASVDAPLSRRGRELREASVPLLFSYENDGERRELSLLLGLFRCRRTPAAWSTRFLWLIHFEGGDADELVEVES